MYLDAGNLGWSCSLAWPKWSWSKLRLRWGYGVPPDSQRMDVWTWLKNALQTGYSLRSTDSLITLLFMHNEWLQCCNFIFNKISSVLIAFSTFLPCYHSPLENTYSDYSGVNISSRISNWIHPSHWMPAPWMAMMGNPTSPTSLSHMTHLHSILKKQKMSQGLLWKITIQ